MKILFFSGCEKASFSNSCKMLSGNYFVTGGEKGSYNG